MRLVAVGVAAVLAVGAGAPAAMGAVHEMGGAGEGRTRTVAHDGEARGTSWAYDAARSGRWGLFGDADRTADRTVDRAAGRDAGRGGGEGSAGGGADAAGVSRIGADGGDRGVVAGGLNRALLDQAGWGRAREAGSPARAAGATAGARPEADLAYHGSATLDRGRLKLRFTPRNHGPAEVPEATVRLRWSEPLADRQTLPEFCARSGEKDVLCRIDALPADGLGERISLSLRLREVPDEVVLELDTVWSGGVLDRNRANDRQRVLVLDTGDPYYF